MSGSGNLGLTGFLQSVFSGATHPKGTMGDFQHAARLYGDNLYALTPKAGWMYYTYFVINPSAQTAISAGANSQSSGLFGTIGQVLGGANVKGILSNGKNQNIEAGMLVKQADLPKFQIQTEQLNQYNRHTNIQTRINYQPVGITFHDDMSNTTSELWQSYFRYYYADTTYGSATSSPTSDSMQQASNPAFGNTKYSPYTSKLVPPNAYGLNNNQGPDPFFRAIIIYQLNRSVFNSYILINPLVTSWDHPHLDQSQTSFSENKMNVQYETVFYGKGRVTRQDPPGMTTFHYDTTPSPLSIQGGGTGTLFGPGGVIAGAEEIFGGNGTGPTSILGTALSAANLAKNVGKLNSAGIQAEGYSILGGVLGTIGNRGNIPSGAPVGIGGGVVGGALSLFKGGNSSTNGQTTASPKGVIGGGAGTDSTGGTSTQLGTTGAVTPDITPLDPTLLPADVDSLNSLSADYQSQVSTLQSQISTAQSQQAVYTQAVANAAAAGGQSAVDDVNAQFASKGYQDPAKLQANLSVLQANQTLVENALTTAQKTEQQPDNLQSDEDTDGPADPQANAAPNDQEAGGPDDNANPQPNNNTTGSENSADVYDV